ncbi:hypothetical protein H6G89_04705 [Oscillatoria sp. FACHB-1407]|uniref:hypothetical protein n=1 Tax=Oscillatoria sp. FACHB-1407 TaxID=2692847 RepID=UPI0016891B06|nr:hypothetical protein [Oscillatoria sp. FACHB-1407]MBD2460338.1 hypothetical protein [Oscillatoria sp. FACHB-1407]
MRQYPANSNSAETMAARLTHSAGTVTLEPPHQTQFSTHSFTLEKGQWLEISREPSVLRVISGNAWVIVEKRDLVLSSGQEKLLPVGKYPAVVLILGDRPVSLEIQSKTPPRLAS